MGTRPTGVTEDDAPGALTFRLLGHGIAYSASPVMMTAAFRAIGLPHRYVLADVPPDGVPDAVAALRNADAGGANVTVPHKAAVAALLDELSDDAREADAVNTIVRDGDRLIGHNTDVAGFARALTAAGFNVRGVRAAVLGAGFPRPAATRRSVAASPRSVGGRPLGVAMGDTIVNTEALAAAIELFLNPAMCVQASAAARQTAGGRVSQTAAGNPPVENGIDFHRGDGF